MNRARRSDSTRDRFVGSVRRIVVSGRNIKLCSVKPSTMVYKSPHSAQWCSCFIVYLVCDLVSFGACDFYCGPLNNLALIDSRAASVAGCAGHEHKRSNISCLARLEAAFARDADH